MRVLYLLSPSTHAFVTVIVRATRVLVKVIFSPPSLRAVTLLPSLSDVTAQTLLLTLVSSTVYSPGTRPSTIFVSPALTVMFSLAILPLRFTTKVNVGASLPVSSLPFTSRAFLTMVSDAFCSFVFVKVTVPLVPTICSAARATA